MFEIVSNTSLKVLVNNFEYFNEPSVDNPLGYLAKDSEYPVVALSTGKIGDWDWAKIVKDGNTYYVALVPDRYELINTGGGTDPETLKRIEALEAEVKVIKDKFNAVSNAAKYE